ncbi:MAG TPA: serine/threonine-protein kinase [Thermoanaerobaculia bacterium]|nr:serine/threonine-protein kinase [Thermoanaerobaculia bacterium]
MTLGAPSEAFWDRVRHLFHAVVELAPHTRAAFLDRECADADARAEVESLLAAHDEAGTFLGKSIWELIDTNDHARLTGRTIGAYRLVHPLGHGGMGSVFLAVRDDEQFSQRVAIKLVRGGAAGAALVRRFRQERQILAALEHPNIARLLDGGTTFDGLPYLVMEYVDGTPIHEYCRGKSTPEKLKLFLNLCDAVQYAHRSLVIHRDIKPANVLVTADGVAKLLDFGIAKLMSDTVPVPADATITRLMTPEYASPEQLLGKPVTTASDVYSLGVLLFELLTEQKPFGERTPLSEPPLPSTITKPLRGDLDNIVLMAMEVDPARRYGSVEKLADDIRRHLSGHPVAARRATFGYRAAKFVRRNRFYVTAVIAMLAVAIIAFAATLRQKRLAEHRFEQVRTLARSVVFELHDAIAPLPGSTPARALLVQRALVYLDALAADAEDNKPLQLELIGAYLKIGDVQGKPYAANLGDTRGAMASYRKALAIAEAVDDPAMLAEVHDRIGFVQQRALRWRDALSHHQTALRLRQHDDLALARTWVAIGDCLYIGRFGDPRESYENALRVLSRTRASRAELLREIARAHQHLGGYFSRQPNQMQRALAHHDAALKALEECAALAPSDAVARRNFADQLVMKATAQNLMHDSAGALAGTERALVIFKELAAADPKNKEAQHDLAFAYEQISLAFLLQKRWPECKRAAEEVLAIRNHLIEADPTNREDRRELSRTYGLLREANEHLTGTEHSTQRYTVE